MLGLNSSQGKGTGRGRGSPCEDGGIGTGGPGGDVGAGGPGGSGAAAQPILSPTLNPSGKQSLIPGHEEGLLQQPPSQFQVAGPLSPEALPYSQEKPTLQFPQLQFWADTSVASDKPNARRKIVVTRNKIQNSVVFLMSKNLLLVNSRPELGSKACCLSLLMLGRYILVKARF